MTVSTENKGRPQEGPSATSVFWLTLIQHHVTSCAAVSVSIENSGRPREGSSATSVFWLTNIQTHVTSCAAVFVFIEFCVD